MPEKIDHTAAIFAKLGVTPETHPWAYKKLNAPLMNLNGRYQPISLLSGTLEADGLAVRLVEIARQKHIIMSPQFAMDLNGWTWCVSPSLMSKDSKLNKSFAVAVHDALCEALGIAEEEKG